MMSETPAAERPKVVVERTYRASVAELWALWTTREGFESWWGPQGFRVEVHKLEARTGGPLHYDMIAATPEMIAAMQDMGQAPSHLTRGWYDVYRPHEHLTLKHIIDFVPGVTPYENTIDVDFYAVGGGQARMVVTLSPLHDPMFSQMQREGFESQLTKLDQRYGWKG